MASASLARMLAAVAVVPGQMVIQHQARVSPEMAVTACNHPSLAPQPTTRAAAAVAFGLVRLPEQVDWAEAAMARTTPAALDRRVRPTPAAVQGPAWAMGIHQPVRAALVL